VPDISKWFEARSTENDSAAVRRHLDALVERIAGVAARRRGRDDVLRCIAREAEPANEPGNPPPA
jgi:hypothetical protein